VSGEASRDGDWNTVRQGSTLPPHGMAPMHIGMMIPRIPPAFSGAGKRGWGMAKAFVERGHRVTVFTYTTEPAPGEPGNIRIVRVPRWQRRHLDRKIFRRARVVALGASVALDFVKHVRGDAPDVILQMACDPGPQLIAPAAWILGIPLIAESTLFGADDPQTIRRSRCGFLRHALLRGADRMVSISPKLHEAAVDSGLDPSRCVIIGNGVDLKRFSPPSLPERAVIRGRLGLAAEDFIVLSVGAVCERKGMLPLVQAFVPLGKADSTARLVIVGPLREAGADGGYLGELRRVVSEEGLENQVVLAGEQTNVDEWHKSADVFVLLSRSEGFGTVVLEAMACGVPLVLREIPGVTQFIVGNTSGATLVRSDEDVTLALQAVRGNELPLEAGQNLRRRVEQNFSDEAICDRYLSLFEEVRRASMQEGSETKRPRSRRRSR